MTTGHNDNFSAVFFAVVISVADLHSKNLDARPLPGPNSFNFNFIQFLGKFGKIVCWRPHFWVNPGSATESNTSNYDTFLIGFEFDLF